MAENEAADVDVEQLLDAYLTGARNWGQSCWDIKASDFASGDAVLKLPPAQQVKAILATLHRVTKDFPERIILERLRGQLLRRKLPYTPHDIIELSKSMEKASYYSGPNKSLLGALEKYAAKHELPAEAVQALRDYADAHPTTDSDGARALGRLRTLVGGSSKFELRRGEAWADAVMEDLDAMESGPSAAWSALLTHCKTASGGKPSGKWQKEATKLVGEVGTGEFQQRVICWFPEVDKRRTQEVEQEEWEPDPNLILDASQVDVLKGLVWCFPLAASDDVMRALTQLALSAYKKVPGVGPRAVALGNAVLYALGAIPDINAVGQLALLKVKVKFGTARKLIEKALTAAAEREGLPREEIEEMAVPAYGLEEVGIRREKLGDFTAELVITDTKSTEIRWIKPDGKPQKSVPKAVKDNFADDLKDLKAAAKDIQKMLPAQRDRIDNLHLQQKTWAYATWGERYLNHPLVGTIARRLIWVFNHGDDDKQAGTWLDGKIVDAAGTPVKVNEQSAIVSLWHPIGSGEAEIVAWREFFESHEIRQPFKQAHREVYLLTDAERNTSVYSNRYAAHIVRQHQFNALCAARGWKNQLRLMVDDSYTPPHLLLPKWGLRAEFWVEGAGEEYGTDTNDTGTYHYLATDQVRFFNIEAADNWVHASGGGYESNAGGPGTGNVNEPVPVDQIPALVLSEVMRDVDLFVGVASVGNNPEWEDGGPEGRYRDYWYSYSFGDLSGTAQTRWTVLDRLLPRLKIADRCHLDDKFLVVRGDVRTYKIHLGSGNILMEPSDQYLCIVSARGGGAAGKVFLPFEGDQRMAIILSKAFLLAADKKITDKTILSQIKRGS